MRFLQHASHTAGIVLLSILPSRARLAVVTDPTAPSDLAGQERLESPMADRIGKGPVEN
jgi:hypothetical protein